MIRTAVDVARATLVALALTVVTFALARHAAAAGCDPAGADAAVVGDARTAVAAACDCAAASSARAWRSCVRAAVAPLLGSGLSSACKRWVERVETRSTCGRQDRVVCCRTSAAGRTTATLRRAGHCQAPAGGLSCESGIAYLEDACVGDGCTPLPTCGNGSVETGEACDPPNGLTCDTSCQACTTELGCVAETSCGDGTLESGEQCDPPNGTTCSSTCTACAPAAAGELLIGCASGQTAAYAAALPGVLLVAYDDSTPGGARHGFARRLANDGTPFDATPLLVTGPVPPSGALGGSTSAATAGTSEFYVVWATSLDYLTVWGGRRIPASGPITADPETVLSSFPVGYCRTYAAGPVNVAPRLDDGFRATWRVFYACGADVYAETLVGVGPFFAFPPPGNLSSGPAPIVRGAADVAAAWWNGFVSSVSPPMVDQNLVASFVEPEAATPTMILLTPGFSSVAPALAAVGDVFVALFTTGTELRAVRFTRAAGALDPSGGLLVATAASPIQRIVAAGDGSNVIAAWIESDGTIRATRLAPDGSLPDPSPTTIATTTANAALDVAANPTTALVAFTRDESAGRSVRGVLLPGW